MRGKIRTVWVSKLLCNAVLSVYNTRMWHDIGRQRV